MREVGDAAPATTGAGEAPQPLLAGAAPPPLTGMLHLTISTCVCTSIQHGAVFALHGLCTCIHCEQELPDSICHDHAKVMVQA